MKSGMKSGSKIKGMLIAGLLMASVVFGACTAHAQSNDRENRSIRVINRSSSAIFHLYVSNVDVNVWGPDQLGFFESIQPGYYEDFNMDDGSGHCLFDVMAVLQDGRKATTRRLNVCTNDTWTVYDR